MLPKLKSASPLKGCPGFGYVFKVPVFHPIPFYLDKFAIDYNGKLIFVMLQSVLLLANSFNYQCTHQHVCHPRCFRRQMRACSRMLTSLRKVYGDEPHLEGIEYLAFNKKMRCTGKEDTKKDKSKTGPSHPGSPLRRRESSSKKDRYELLQHCFYCFGYDCSDWIV